MKQLPSLNGLRAVSITIVILEHLLRLNLHFSNNILLFPLFNGGLGVNVFFVISGFLITSLLLEEEKITGRISIKNFYIRRIFRIFPAYFFLLIVYANLQWLGYLRIPLVFWIMLLTYTRYIRIPGEIYTAHAWSLSVEENFYFLWPAVFRLGDSQRKNTALFFIFIVPMVRIFLFMHPVGWIGEESLFVRIDSIAMGCCVALYRVQLLSFFSSYWNRLFYSAVALLFLFPWIARWFILHRLGGIFIPFGILDGMVANTLVSIIMLYSIYGPKGNWYRLLNTRAFNYIGILSYSIYLWQQIFVLSHPSWWVARFPQNLACVFLAALFSYYVIEKPFLRLKSKFASRSIPQAPSSSVTTPSPTPAAAVSQITEK
jgi:peptidoglycan/LPS O-acetylase OafA/YrhL